eukprot:TRINITY_DN9749_c0_g1_i1.p1 TRINITY_DN9749_c0_g1~~TRINITY_DN9749_c0_g1_i1.p1  ORF type:complete len:675 (+),score=89.82 TRINITY_DN9749_c0_g1_i1:70-2025(+)
MTEPGPIVNFIALAEFDIDTGAVVRVRHPKRKNVDMSYICEQMLPDRCEGYDDMRTIFFVNRGDPDKAEEFIDGIPSEIYRKSQNDPPAKPWKLLLDEHYISKVGGELFTKNRQCETKQSIPIADSDLSLKKVPQPDNVTTKTDDPVYYILSNTGSGCDLLLCVGMEYSAVLENWVLENGDDPVPKYSDSFLYCMNKVRNRRDSSVRRGAIVKGISLGCENPRYLNCFEELLEVTLEMCLDLKEGSDPVEQQKLIQHLYEAINGSDQLSLRDIPPEAKDPLRCQVWRESLLRESKVTHKVDITVYGKQYGIVIPYHVDEGAVLLQGSVTLLLETFKEGITTILNAVMSGLRVVFLTYQRSAADICSVVLAAASLASPCCEGILNKTFPYTSLTCMHYWTTKQKDGCIVGATNPMFEHHPEWWDVLCSVDTGKIKIGAGTPQGVKPNAENKPIAVTDAAHTAIDNNLVARLQSIVQQSGDDSERALRYHIKTYVSKIFDISSGTFQDIHGDGDLQQFWEANAQRIRRWRNGGMLKRLPADSVKVRELKVLLHRLRSSTKLTSDDTLLVYQSLYRTVRELSDMFLLLSMLPPEGGGLFPVAIGLFHPSDAVQVTCVAVLRRLDSFPEGTAAIHSLNTFMLLAYENKNKTLPQT